MTQGESAALVVAIIALIISVLAAGFTGWQAITEHLARTQPRPAMWTIDFEAGRRDIAGRSAGWTLHNVGGSVATDVTIRMGMPRKTVGDPYLQFAIGQAVPAGGSVPVPGTDKVVDPRLKFYPNPKPDKPGSYSALNPGETRDDALYFTDQYATIHWRDYKGRMKRGRIPLR